MPTRLNPYLNFRDSTKAAMEFYHSVFGGELMSMTYSEYNVSEDPAEADKIMHAQLETPGDLMLMAADVPNALPLAAGDTITVSLSGSDETELRGYWDKLSQGAKITLPLEKAPWGDSFGQLIDKFGTPWLFNIGSTSAD